MFLLKIFLGMVSQKVCVLLCFLFLPSFGRIRPSTRLFCDLCIMCCVFTKVNKFFVFCELLGSFVKQGAVGPTHLDLFSLVGNFRNNQQLSTNQVKQLQQTGSTHLYSYSISQTFRFTPRRFTFWFSELQNGVQLLGIHIGSDSSDDWQTSVKKTFIEVSRWEK